MPASTAKTTKPARASRAPAGAAAAPALEFKVKDLSLARAQGVIQALLARYPDFGKVKDKFVADGMGWDKPLANDALSRRVEIRVIPPEE